MILEEEVVVAIVVLVLSKWAVSTKVLNDDDGVPPTPPHGAYLSIFLELLAYALRWLCDV